MHTTDILAEAAAIVRDTTRTRLRRALDDRRRALQTVRAQLRAGVATDDPALTGAVQQAATAWDDAGAWWRLAMHHRPR